MAISHADHNHPNTPAARAACRKRMNAGKSPRDEATERALNFDPFTKPSAERKLAEAAGIVKPAKIASIEMKGRASGRWKNTNPDAAPPRRMKVSGTLIKSTGDLADVPAVLATAVRESWKRGWTVQAGYPFNETERRIVITAPLGEIALVWSEDGRTGVFVRRNRSSVTKRADSWMAAFDAASA